MDHHFQLTKGCHGYRNRVPAEPEFIEYDFRGRHYLWDPNSMVLADHEGEVPEAYGSQWKPTFALANPPTCPHLVLELTDACNLACSYCFVAEDNARSRAKKTMTFETAVEAISKFSLRATAMPTPSRPVSIGFFGGEPLVAGDLIRKIVKYASNVFGSRSCRFHITTNGTLIDEEWARYIGKNRFSLIVSIDGPKHAHDVTRKTHGGEGSYDRVIKALELLRTYAPMVIKSTTLRATFTSDSNCSLVDRLKHLNHLCDRGMGSHVSVEPAFLGERVCFDKSKAANITPDPKTQERWMEEVHAAADWYIERIRAGKLPPRYHHFGIHIKRLLKSQPQPSECGAGKGYFSVGTDGTVYACHRETATKVGHLEYGVDHQLAAPWQDNRYYARRGCVDCWMRNICGGGCREIAVVQNGDIASPVSSECAFKELWFKEAAHIIAEIKTTEWVHRLPFLKQVVGLGASGVQKCATQ